MAAWWMDILTLLTDEDCIVIIILINFDSYISSVSLRTVRRHDMVLLDDGWRTAAAAALPPFYIPAISLLQKDRIFDNNAESIY